MGNSKPSPASPLALLNPAPTLGEQPSADETATIHDLAGTHARLETAEVRYAFHAGYLAALHSMRDTVTTGATPAVRPGTVLTDAEREEVARVVESVLQRRRAAETPNHPAAAPDWLRSRPHWCTLCPTTGHNPFTGHGAADHPDDRHHIGAYHCVPLHTMDYVPDGVSHTWRPREIMTALTQGYREIEPRVLLTDSTDTVELRLSLGEARQLRDHLDELLADADGDLPSTGVVQAARDVLAGAHAGNVRWGEVAPPPPSCEAGPLAGVALVGGAR
ncbi:hypothetical protein GCM10017673_57600 [Streptosporangium violaceochromogenes]|nr:hypothetical protein GCM10017673_57600 [Streptosporangium violaceochromogenes]